MSSNNEGMRPKYSTTDSNSFVPGFESASAGVLLCLQDGRCGGKPRQIDGVPESRAIAQYQTSSALGHIWFLKLSSPVAGGSESGGYSEPFPGGMKSFFDGVLRLALFHPWPNPISFPTAAISHPLAPMIVLGRKVDWLISADTKVGGKNLSSSTLMILQLGNRI